MSGLSLRPVVGPRRFTSPLVQSLQRNFAENLSMNATRDLKRLATLRGTDEEFYMAPDIEDSRSRREIRTDHTLKKLLADGQARELTDDEVIMMVGRGQLQLHNLERVLEDFDRAVRLRRIIVFKTSSPATNAGKFAAARLPYENFNWKQVYGACCENVIGYMPVPVGVAGSLLIDDKAYMIPMATTEGALVASISRGCKALNAGGGVTTAVTYDGMTRGPCLSFANLKDALKAKIWLESETGQRTMKAAFDSSSRFTRLRCVKPCIAGSYLYIRFKATTGDAMGMNMVSKGVQAALSRMAAEEKFADMKLVSLSGNLCADKKSSAVNWIEGRGKGVSAEAMISEEVVIGVLKTDIDSLVELNVSKNMIGSAMAGSIGGYNAHAANTVSAIFLATGQDIAQILESSNCITIMKRVEDNLQISVTMPSLEVGTVGGGTQLDSQCAMLDLLGVRGPNENEPGFNARQLARIIGAATLAGELSLCSALAAGHLVDAHLKHNRKSKRD